MCVKHVRRIPRCRCARFFVWFHFGDGGSKAWSPSLIWRDEWLWSWWWSSRWVIPTIHGHGLHCFIRTTAEFSAFVGELACSITHNSTLFGPQLLGSHSFSHHFLGFLPDTPSFSSKNSTFPEVFPAFSPKNVGGSSSWSWAPWASWRCRPRVPPGRGTRGWEGSTRRSALVKSLATRPGQHRKNDGKIHHF